MNDRLRPSHLALGLLAVGVLAPRAASAQFMDRLSLHGEFGVGSMLSSYQKNTQDLGLGFQGSLRGGIQLIGPLSLQISGSYWDFPSSGAAGGGFASTLTGGLRLEHPFGSLGRLFVDANAGAGFTGSKLLVRFAWDAGIGFEFHIFGPLYLGPAVRVGQLTAASTDIQGSATYFSAGISIGLHHHHHAAPPPPVDSDGDGVADPDDLCPTVPAGAHPDPARPGCPVGDRDNDGVLDPDDQCPDVPAGAHPDPAHAGCPLGDRDHDGVFDPQDQCPDTPAGAHPDPTRPGCPAGDQDHDGVLDPDDQCPTVPAGEHPDATRRGCPASDRDGDSVPDNVDHCPDQPGAPSPDPLRNGCPGLVQIEGGQVRINRPVFFATNRDTILPRSFPVLQAVADALRASPGIHSVAVEGHTDRVGTEPHNQELSQHRAESVLHWLTAHQVTTRLEAHGYGSSRPVASNLLASGRAQNRRVEFHITDPAPPGGSSAPPPPAPVPATHPAAPAAHPLAHPAPTAHPAHPPATH